MTPARLYLGLLYVALWAVALTAPAGPDPLMPSLVAMLTLSGPDPWTAVLFNLMGLWPLAYVALVGLDGPGQRIPGWPFLLGAFAGGMFVLMPYLLLRRPEAPRRADGTWARFCAHRGLGVVILLGTLGLVSFAALTGSLDAVWQGVREDGFTRTFVADFGVFWAASGVVLADDLRRFERPKGRVGWAAIPLLGLALHLLTRKES